MESMNGQQCQNEGTPFMATLMIPPVEVPSSTDGVRPKNKNSHTTTPAWNKDIPQQDYAPKSTESCDPCHKDDPQRGSVLLKTLCLIHTADG